MRLLLLASLASVAIVACASNQRAQQVPAAQAMPGASPQRDEIARLSQEIESQRSTLGLGATSARPMNAGSDTAGCTRSTASTCTQSCTLSDSICDNAKKICELAKQLPGDAWAEQKCSDGSATCDQARARCCACT